MFFALPYTCALILRSADVCPEADPENGGGIAHPVRGAFSLTDTN